MYQILGGRTFILILISPEQTQASCLSLTPTPVTKSFSQVMTQSLVDGIPFFFFPVIYLFFIGV